MKTWPQRHCELAKSMIGTDALDRVLLLLSCFRNIADREEGAFFKKISQQRGVKWFLVFYTLDDLQIKGNLEVLSD